MSFGVKNGPPTYKKAMTKTFREYLDNFMKIFLDDFTVYSDMESHLQKLKLHFQKCKEYGINLFKQMCIYGVFGDDIGFYYFQRRKTIRSKENTSNSKHATT